MDLQLKGRTTIVTGAGSGIGRSIARILALEGAHVLAVARSETDLRSLAREVEADGACNFTWRSLDLTSGNNPELLARDALETFGAVDILVNNAGASMPVEWNASEDVWQAGMLLNFEIHRRLTQAVLPYMIERHWGRVINVTGSIELKQINVAACAKAALTLWSKGLAEQVGHHGITCNCIEPGLIHSNQFKDWPEAQIQAAAKRTSMRSFGVPEDVGSAAAFLASSQAKYITGTTVIVDGGFRQRSF